jgi:PAS domain S-box-containing protein
MEVPPLPPNESERVAALHKLNLLDTVREDRFDRITRVAAALFDVPVALISLVDSDRQWFKSCYGVPFDQTPRTTSFCAHAILQENILLVPDAQKDPRFKFNPLVSGVTENFRFYAGCPLISPDGYKIGTLCVLDRQARTLTEEQVVLLKDLAIWAQLEVNPLSALRSEITKKAEELRETEETFFKFMESLPVGVFVLSSDGTPYYANKTAQQLLGKGIIKQTTPDELAETYRAFVADTDMEYPTERMPIVRALQGLSTEVDDMEIHTPSGNVCVQVWGTPIFDSHGLVTHAIAAFQDVTARKHTQRRLAVQYAVSRTLSEAGTLAEATPRILQAICESLRWPVGAIWIIDHDANEMYCLDFWHHPATQVQFFEALTRKFRFAPGVGLPGRVWSSKQPIWISDIVEDPNFPRTPAAIKDNLHAAFAFPILLGSDIIGVIEFFSKQNYEPDRELLSMFAALGSQLGQFIARKKVEQQLLDTEERFRQLTQRD